MSKELALAGYLDRASGREEERAGTRTEGEGGRERVGQQGYPCSLAMMTRHFSYTDSYDKARGNFPKVRQYFACPAVHAGQSDGHGR